MFHLCQPIAEGGDNQAGHTKVRMQEASCFGYRTRVAHVRLLALTLISNKKYQGSQAEPRGRCPSWKMQYRTSNSGEYQLWLIHR